MQDLRATAMEPKMTTHISGSAKIYTFPPRGRFALRMNGDTFDAAANVQLPRGAELTSGASGWYHDEAIADARKSEPGRRN